MNYANISCNLPSKEFIYFLHISIWIFSYAYESLLCTECGEKNEICRFCWETWIWQLTFGNCRKFSSNEDAFAYMLVTRLLSIAKSQLSKSCYPLCSIPQGFDGNLSTDPSHFSLSPLYTRFPTSLLHRDKNFP